MNSLWNLGKWNYTNTTPTRSRWDTVYLLAHVDALVEVVEIVLALGLAQALAVGLDAELVAQFKVAALVRPAHLLGEHGGGHVAHRSAKDGLYVIHADRTNKNKRRN